MIVRQAWKGPLLRTATDSGKGHDVARPGGTEIVDEVQWCHVVSFTCQITSCDEDVGCRGRNLEIAMTIQRTRRPSMIRRESDEAGPLRQSTVQEHRNIVIEQLHRMSRVPRVFGWSTQPCTKLSVPLLGSRDVMFEGLNIKSRGM